MCTNQNSYDDPSTLAGYFNPDNPEHVRAYQHTRTAGAWPDWFLAELRENNVTISDLWESIIRNRMAERWMQHTIDIDDGFVPVCRWCQQRVELDVCLSCFEEERRRQHGLRGEPSR